MRSPAPIIPSPPPLPNTYWVIPGRLLAGEYPGVAQADRTRTRLKKLIEAGVSCFVDLTMPDELPPYATLLPRGVEHLRNSIFDHDIPANAAEMSMILDCVKRALKAGRGVYVHCRAGIGRTGTVIGCLLADGGLKGEDALAELNRLWQQCARAQQWMSVPETEDQVEFVRKWRSPSGEARSDKPTPAASSPTVVKRPPPLRATPAAPSGVGVAQPNSTARTQDSSRLAQGLPRPAPLNVDTPNIALDRQAIEDVPQPPAETTRERYLGALLGLAVGDALAVATQGQPRGTFAPVVDLAGGGPFNLPRGAWSDDTAMALCLAESLLECRGFDARDQVERYGQWQQQGYLSATGQCVGITQNTARSLAMAQWRRQLFAGSHDPKQAEPTPLSRIAPTVMFFLPFKEQALEFAGDSARTTCQAPVVLQACRLFAAMLHSTLLGMPKAQVLVPVWDVPEEKQKARIRGLLQSRYRTKDPMAIRAGEHIAEALEVALWAFDRTNSFAAGALLVVNVGEGCDVAAAAYGQLAGAFYGVEAIPAPWRNVLMKKELIESLAMRLLAQTQVDAV